MQGRQANATATVLCSDLVGSTELMSQLGDALFDEFRRGHFDTLRACVSRHGGQVVKTLGDGVLAVFASAADSLSCAVAMQRAVDHPLRVGLALGDVVFEDDDVFGAPVVEAARLVAGARSGQILATAIVPTVAGGRSTNRCASLGPMTLRGLPEPVAVCEVVWEPPDAPGRAEAAEVGDTGPVGNLTAEPTPFVGRAGELGAVRALLGATRLLTVVGPGGAGKTRLAKAAAAAAADCFADGAWFVELAPVPEPALVTAAVVTALGLEVAGMPGPAKLTQELHTHIGGRQLLLVLDNCEHLVEECAAFVDTLLRRCPRVTVLATSREVLNAPGESVWPIPPLSLPPERPEAPGDLGGSDAVQLFCGRARAALPSFVLDDDNAPAVARICRSLDGMPLALELAAARVRVLSLRQIADRLADRFALLQDGPAPAERHHTLRATMDWSHDLLTDAEKVVLRRLSVFPAGFDIAAAEAVVLEAGTLTTVSRLIDKSLVTSAPGGDTARYRLLETVRQYADERLQEAGEAEQVRARHTAWFGGIARRWLAEPSDAWWTANDWTAVVGADEANFRAAVTQAISKGETGVALDLVAALWLFWVFSSRQEMRGWLAWAVSATEGGGPPLARVSALSGLAFWNSYGDELDRASAPVLLATARAEAHASGDPQVLGCAYYASAEVALGQRDLATARSFALVCLEAYQEAKARVLAGYAERLLGWVALSEGDDAAARTHFERSLEAGWPCDIATAHAAAALAPLIARAGDGVRAGALADEAVARARRLRLRVLEAMTLAQAAKARILAGDPAAAGHLDDLLALLARTGAHSYMADAVELAAVLLLTSGRAREAAPLIGVCDRIRSARGEPGLPDLAAECAAARARGRAALGAGEWDAAVARGALLSLQAAAAAARAALSASDSPSASAQLRPLAEGPSASPQLRALTEGTSASAQLRALAEGRSASAQPPVLAEAPSPASAPATAALRRDGEMWELRFRGERARLRHTKGIADLATLVSRPGEDIHVLDLASPDPVLARSEPRGAPVLDDRALAAYRRRLRELDEAEKTADERQLAELDAERAALVAELRVASGLGGRVRPLGGDATERARKAVAARLRDAVRRIAAELPDLGAHLDRSLVTGACCRYQPREPVTWAVTTRPAASGDRQARPGAEGA